MFNSNKIRKPLVIALCLATVLTVTAVVAIGNASVDKFTSSKTPEIRTAEDVHGNPVKAEYQYSQNSSAFGVINKYEDENGNTFTYTADGKLLTASYVPDFTRSAPEKTVAELRGIAEDFAKDKSDDFARYAFRKETSKNGYSTFYYAVKVGDFFTDESIIINVKNDGQITSYSNTNHGKFDGVTESVLGDVTVAELEEYADYAISVLYGDDVKDVEIDSMRLTKDGDTYGISLSLTLKMASGYDSAETVIYELD